MKNLSKTCINKTQVLLDDLHKHSSKQMNAKELDVAISALDVITTFTKHNNSQDFVNKRNSENLINTASNLLELRNAKSWLRLRQVWIYHHDDAFRKGVTRLLILGMSSEIIPSVLAYNLRGGPSQFSLKSFLMAPKCPL
jgi:flagellar motor component MotA